MVWVVCGRVLDVGRNYARPNDPRCGPPVLRTQTTTDRDGERLDGAAVASRGIGEPDVARAIHGAAASMERACVERRAPRPHRGDGRARLGRARPRQLRLWDRPG